ncbi:uncharacterized protein B0H18DRAFT_866139, partial [Fomitopsis serialis]|uniref:uncharacterized protein n=1 Tax=Fomitopsis serialis TaxID=139415 RepID=UPI0020079596
KKARYSLDTVDRLFETAFATATRVSLPRPSKSKMEEAKAAEQEPPPASPTAVGSLYTAPMAPEDDTPDSLWEEVRRLKEKSLAKSPPKVRSIEQALSSG